VNLGSSLSIPDLAAIAGGAEVALAPGAELRLQRAYAFVQDLARSGAPVYGLTTGCGPLAGHAIPAAQREEFQRNLVRSHACTIGAPHPVELVRAAMALRAHVFARGCSGVDPRLVELMIAMLNRGIHPLVRQIGGVGASGDLVELAQLALALLGEGTVVRDGRELPSAEALRDAGLEPIAPRFREGLALMNATSFHTAAAALVAARARDVLAAAETAAAMVFEALGGHAEALAAELHAARGQEGQRAVAARLERRLEGSRLVRRQEPAAARQDAYTLRCIPQILGAVADQLAAAEAVVERELDGISDNPLFLVDERRVLHGGNFHGQPVAAALDQMKLALVEIGVQSERRLARLLDPLLNAGLPPFLVQRQAGLHSGFMGLQYCASAMAADNAVLAAPASVRSVPTNANNQDVVSMGMVAARQASQVLDNARRMVAIELLCAAQALDLRGLERAGAASRAAHAAVRARVAPLLDDRPLGGDVEEVAALVAAGAFGGRG